MYVCPEPECTDAGHDYITARCDDYRCREAGAKAQLGIEYWATSAANWKAPVLFLCMEHALERMPVAERVAYRLGAYVSAHIREINVHNEIESITNRVLENSGE